MQMQNSDKSNFDFLAANCRLAMRQAIIEPKPTRQHESFYSLAEILPLVIFRIEQRGRNI
jgi:hypothetical protein